MHILIIPDGNRRWARKTGKKNVFDGHRQGVDASKEILKEALLLNINYLTLWTCSPNNLTQRPKIEVAVLHEVLKRAFTWLAGSDEVHSNEVHIEAVGRWRDELLCPLSLQRAIEKCMRVTSSYNRFWLTILVAYSGMEEMVDAVRRIAARKPPVIDQSLVKDNLWTGNLPPVDLIIRTGVEGDPHNSDGAMMWHTAFSQHYFTETYWPAFTKEEFRQAVQEFSRRERRYGS